MTATLLDESFFGSPKEGGGRGRGMAKQKVLVGLALTKDGKPLHLRLLVLPGLDVAIGPIRFFNRCVAAVTACPIWTYRDITGVTSVDMKDKLRVA